MACNLPARTPSADTKSGDFRGFDYIMSRQKLETPGTSCQEPGISFGRRVGSRFLLDSNPQILLLFGGVGFRVTCLGFAASFSGFRMYYYYGVESPTPR